MSERFGIRLARARERFGPLCVGIDPHPAILREWGLTADGQGLREFGLRVVDAASGQVGIVKPQVAFFEAAGAAGFAALEEVLAAARSAGLLTIADAKRGDIGTTMTAYASAWFDPASPLAADALTVTPYVGVGALRDAFATASAHGAGAFVLAATSNPEAGALQQATAGQRSVARLVRDEVVAAVGPSVSDGFADIGIVVGATIDPAPFDLVDEPSAPLPVLAPGFGAQGAVATDLPRLFGAGAHRVIANESRSVLSGDPAGLRVRIAAAAAAYSVAA